MTDSKATLASLEKEWTEMYPELMYDFDFLDQLTAGFYQTEETMLKMIEVFSLSRSLSDAWDYMAWHRSWLCRRQKRLGSGKYWVEAYAHILGIFVKEFSRLIVIAFILAAPLGWYLMSNWLQGFAFHINMTGWILLAEVLIIASIVLLTVGYKALRSAVMNPVKALRTE